MAEDTEAEAAWMAAAAACAILRCGPSDHGMINEALKGSDRTCSLRGPVNPHCPIYCMKLFSLFILVTRVTL